MKKKMILAILVFAVLWAWFTTAMIESNDYFHPSFSKMIEIYENSGLHQALIYFLTDLTARIFLEGTIVFLGLFAVGLVLLLIYGSYLNWKEHSRKDNKG